MATGAALFLRVRTPRPAAAGLDPDHWSELVDGDVLALAEEATAFGIWQSDVDQAVTTNGAFTVEFRSRMPDGSYKWRRGRGRIRRIGASRRLIGAIIDIEHERGILDQLAQNAERLALAEEVAGFGVWEF